MLTFFFFFNDTATTEIYTLSLHDALPIYDRRHGDEGERQQGADAEGRQDSRRLRGRSGGRLHAVREVRGEARALPRQPAAGGGGARQGLAGRDRESTRLNSRH